VRGTLAAFAGAGLTVFVMFGAAFAAIVFAVAHDRMFAQFASAFRAVAGTFSHRSDSILCGRPVL
jgi:hypothetical protein